MSKRKPKPRYRSLWVACKFFRWESLSTTGPLGAVKGVRHEDEPAIGFMPVYETCEEAMREHPDTKVLSITVEQKP